LPFSLAESNQKSAFSRPIFCRCPREGNHPRLIIASIEQDSSKWRLTRAKMEAKKHQPMKR
jgi:hypothetical protein